MRTRFICTDYFAPSTAPHQALDFLRLPPPHHLPPPPPSGAADHLLTAFFDAVPELHQSLDLEPFAIQGALSKFFSDVLPVFIDLEAPVCSANNEDKSVPSFDVKENTCAEVVEFEVPELDISLEDESVFGRKLKLLTEVLEADNNLDINEPIHYPSEVLESFYLIDDITSNHRMEPQTLLLEDVACVQDQMHPIDCSFPLFEVDEISLGIINGVNAEEGVLLLDKIEPLACTQRGETVDVTKEMLGSLDIDVLNCVSGPPLLKHNFSNVVGCSSIYLEMDLISIIELSHLEGNQAYQGDTEDYRSTSEKILKFEEFHFLDHISYPFEDVFDNFAVVTEAQTCEKMSLEGLNFRDVNDLVVSHELTLIDESFKSLPVPILSDHGKMSSHFELVEEILASLEPLPPSAADGIYLDWHFLDGDYGNKDKYSSCWKQVLEITRYSIDPKSFIVGMAISDFVFNDAPNVGNIEDNKETLEILSAGVSTAGLDDFATGRLNHDNRQKSGNRKISSDFNDGNFSLMVGSMSPFDDLKFFLNPREATAVRSSKPSTKVLNGVMRSKGKMTDSTVPAISSLDQGVDMSCNTSIPRDVEELLNILPSEKNYHMEPSSNIDKLSNNEMERVSKNLPNGPSAAGLVQNPDNVSSYPDRILIVNTQNEDKEMIISRRCTYQKILAMEKRGAQVVERDLRFPVDLIISAAICLVWYDCGNIRKKATAPDEASSCLPLCIENIAANILTSLSFSFSSCILVFEGESNFISAVMESSDTLYAAAFSLRMDLQLFFSHSSELTDEIILSCIESATKSNRQTHPKMPESETLAEFFLTSFPSLNPLSAHAILSSVGTLVEFLDWSRERRLHGVQKYHVPNESLRLLSTLCRYGEREDSRSGMTDCSSSVSSAPESRSYRCKPSSVEKGLKYVATPCELDSSMDDLFNFEQLNQYADNNLLQPKTFKSHDAWISESEKKYDEIEETDVFNKGLLFDEKNGITTADMATVMNSSKDNPHIDSRIPRSPMSNDIKKRPWPFGDKLFCPGEAGGASLTHELGCDFNYNSGYLREDLRGEVIDVTDCFPKIDGFSSVQKSVGLADLRSENDGYTVVGNSRTARRFSFNREHLPTFPTADHLPIFPTAAEISSDLSAWDPVNDYTRQSSREAINKHTNQNFTRNKLPLKHQRELIGENSDHRAASYFSSQSQREKHSQLASGTALANAVLSAQPQQGSPWTMEFLNRIREKSRLRQQALPPNMSPLCSPFSESTPKKTKRKSQSILNFFKYQGGSTPRKIIEKRKRQSSQPPASSKKEKAAPPSLSALTPLDKRARRTLSFSMGGGRGQSKLIWCDQDTDRRFYQ